MSARKLALAIVVVLGAASSVFSEKEDLARRSTRGEFRPAEKSGHFIQRDQPELVIQAIRDILSRASRQ